MSEPLNLVQFEHVDQPEQAISHQAVPKAHPEPETYEPPEEKPKPQSHAP